MTRDRGVVLINALVIVLVISGLAAALLLRSESARIRAVQARSADQLSLNLDSAEAFVPALLQQVVENAVAHSGQAWSDRSHEYPIGEGRVTIRLSDLQGRLNVNWLIEEDEYTRTLFSAVFNELGVANSLVAEMAEFVSATGPVSAPYLARTPPVIPPGGAIRTVDDLRALSGLRESDFVKLRPFLAALPTDTRLNLNTAAEVIRKAAVQPLPAELASEILERDAPISSISELRTRAIEILNTEDLDHLPFDRMTVGSSWFQAHIRVYQNGYKLGRKVNFRIAVDETVPVERTLRWFVFD